MQKLHATYIVGALIIALMLPVLAYSSTGTYNAAECAKLVARGVICVPGVTKKDGVSLGITKAGAGSTTKCGDAFTFLLSRLSKSDQDHVKKLNPEFAQRLAKFMCASPYKMTIFSGYRSCERQCGIILGGPRSSMVCDAATTQRLLKSGRKRPGVGSVGGSRHQHGLAVDLSYGVKIGNSMSNCRRNAACNWAHTNAKTFGLRFPVLKGCDGGALCEPWHIEPAGVPRSGKRCGTYSGDIPGSISGTPSTIPVSTAGGALKKLLSGDIGGAVSSLTGSKGLGDMLTKALGGAKASSGGSGATKTTSGTSPTTGSSVATLSAPTTSSSSGSTTSTSTASSTVTKKDEKSVVAKILLEGIKDDKSKDPKTTIELLRQLAEEMEEEKTEEKGKVVRIIDVPLPQAGDIARLVESIEDVQIVETTSGKEGVISFRVEFKEGVDLDRISLPEERDPNVSGFEYLDSAHEFSSPAENGFFGRACHDRSWLGHSVSGAILSSLVNKTCDAFGFFDEDLHAH